jgi:hypothetical protein
MQSVAGITPLLGISQKHGALLIVDLSPHQDFIQ